MDFINGRTERFTNRPRFNPATALGEPDPAFDRGLPGFIEQDPAAFAKGLASVPLTVAPDLVGLAQQGGNFAANKTLDALTGVEGAAFQPFGEPMSGDPIREAIGLDPESQQGIMGEIASPVATAAKGFGLAAQGLSTVLPKLAVPLAAIVAPKAEALARLGRKLKRAPEIGVQVNAPMTLLAEGQIPFTIGRLSTEDWIKRTESILTPEEIVEARTWYSQIDEVFRPVFGEGTDTMITAFLIANKNASPEQSLHNALRVAEQLHSGVTGKKGGLNDKALREFMSGKPVTSGVGQKLFDFIDSAFDRDTRTLYGHAPEAGMPVANDVHTARDMGYVDQPLINALERKGYDTSEIKLDFKVDKKGDSAGPTETQYERGGDQLREMTEQLNEVGFAGGDLRPAEAQAIGWVAMSKFVGAEGQDPLQAITGNVRRIAFELAPGRGSPSALKFGDRFSELGLEDQVKLTNDVLDGAIKHAEEAAGIQASTLVSGTGGWQRFDPNPAQVNQVVASKEGAELVANMIGYSAQQEAVWVSKMKPMTKNPKGFGIMLSGEHLGDDNVVRSLWGSILDNDKSGLVQGYQPVTTIDGRPGIMMLVDRGGKKTGQMIDTELRKTLESVVENGPADDIVVDIGEAEITKAGTEAGTYDGQTYLERIRELGREDVIPGLDRNRVELEEKFGQALDKAEAKAASAGPTGAAPLIAPPVVDGKMRLTHFSKQEDLPALDPAQYGSGIRGAERKRRDAYPEFWVDRTYFGIEPGVPGGYRKEVGLGDVEYNVEVPAEEMYDLAADQLGLFEKLSEDVPKGARLSAVEKQLKEMGFQGYWVNSDSHGLAGAIFNETKPL